MHRAWTLWMPSGGHCSGRPLLPLLLLSCILAPATASTSISWEDCIHPHSELEQTIHDNRGSTLPDALEAAADFLSGYEAANPLFCRVTRIGAPLGGWLIDGLADFEIGGGAFRTFRVGVSDELAVFCILARGIDDQGAVIWSPAPGPDFTGVDGEPIPEELLQYEFLIDREAFEAIEDDYPRPVVPDNSGNAS
jgi:hypothetical protein